jgi:hypothetical protein
MKKILLLCTVSIILLSAGVASAKKSPYQNIALAGSWSALPASVTSTAGPGYKNIVDAARWSTLPRPLSARKTGRTVRAQDPSDFDQMFEPFGSPTWKGCVRRCLESAMEGTGTLCTSNCVACAVVGAPWSCAICAACGTVGFVSIEFCTLHCCVNPGCPAMVELDN